jgi:hypothetical protein
MKAANHIATTSSMIPGAVRASTPNTSAARPRMASTHQRCAAPRINTVLNSSTEISGTVAPPIEFQLRMGILRLALDQSRQEASLNAWRKPMRM